MQDPRRQTEAGLQAAILDYLSGRGHFAWRQNTLPVPIIEGADRRFVGFRPAPTKGIADILGVTGKPGRGRPIGILIAIEVKSRTGKTSPEQERFLGEVMRRGGIALVAKSIDDVIAAGL